MANGLNQQFRTIRRDFFLVAEHRHGQDAARLRLYPRREQHRQSRHDRLFAVAGDGQAGQRRFLQRDAYHAYYLPSQVNQTMFMNLSNGSDFFFTDLITGCQFMAYGNNRHDLTVCHMNALGEGAADYERAATGIREYRFPR